MKNVLRLAISLLCITLAQLGTLQAATTLSTIFGNNMVLQCDMPTKVWGWDDPGQTVNASIGDSRGSAKADADGKWVITLPAQAASNRGQTLTVKGSSQVTAKDVLFGEVWVLFGRSNVSFPVLRMDNADEEIANANFPDVRTVTLRGEPTLEPQQDAETRGWQAVSTRNANRMSAVGHIFSSELHKAREVPVGLIRSNWGGSPGYMWIERSIYEKTFPPNGDENLEWLEAFEAQSQQYHTTGEGKREYVGKKEERVGALYPSFVAPLLGLSVRGVIFYCSGTTAQETEVVARTWRHAWGQPDLPFLYVQIPPSGGPPEPDPVTKDPGFNASFFQLDRSGRIDNSSMIVTVDTGNTTSPKRDIHPPNKRPVGERLALAARGLANGEAIVYAGPMYASHESRRNKMALTFTDIGSGLTAKDGELEGFAVSEDGQQWSWAKASINGDIVILETQLSAPKYIRYAIGNNTKGNLYNQDGLPAAPFATDITYP